MGLPALSPTMEKGNLIKWTKAEGDAIAPGDIIAEIETDKAVMELEAQDEAVLAKILVAEGTNDIRVGQPIAVTVADADDVAAFADFDAESLQRSAAPAASPARSADDNDDDEQAGEAAGEQPAAAERASSAPAGGRALPAGFAALGLPALSPTMEQGNLVAWRKAVGDTIAPGDIIAEIETDKAVMEFEAQEDGVLAQILVPEGTSGVKVGDPIAIITEDEDADLSQVKDFTADDLRSAGDSGEPAASKKAAPEAKAPPKKEQPKKEQPKQSQPSPAQHAPAADGERVNASPYARRILREAGVTPQQLGGGSGPRNRIVARDLEGKDLQQLTARSAAPATTQSGEKASSKSQMSSGAVQSGELSYETIPHSNMRRVIAQRLTESKQQVPHYYLTMEMRVDNVMELRKRLGDKGIEPKPSLNDFVVKASAAALRRVPDVNASWGDDAILRYNEVDIAVAVATERGLITPIVHDADQLGVAELAKRTRELAARARDGKLQPHEFQGGTFTVSNLGMFGISHFTAVINPPQAAILAVGGVERRVVPGASAGQFETHSILKVTLSCDHRVIDGAVGAQWLQAFKQCMEDPVMMVL